MSEITKQENRIMGDYSIAKSYKGILRIGPILDLVKNQDDELYNTTYYGKPKALIDLSKGMTEAQEKGFRNPYDGMCGNIARYLSIDEEGNIKDELKHLRVPMTDSMGNFINWFIGLDGITIGSNYSINGNSVEITNFLDFKQEEEQYLNKINQKNYKTILQRKFFPILESEEIKIGLGNKDYPSDKYKVNNGSQLIIENYTNDAQLIVENGYDKSTRETTETENGKTLIKYATDEKKKFRTIYKDDKSNVEEYDVFMYQQDNYDCDNYDYKFSDDDVINGNSVEVLKKWRPNSSEFGDYNNEVKNIDSIAGIVNLKSYISDMIEKYTNSNLVEVPTGTIINQFCSLEKWYAFEDLGGHDYVDSGEQVKNFPGHRPPMMSKSNAANPFSASTYMGACKKINRLSYQNEAGVTKSLDEIIPLYKRDYVLCDGSVYGVFTQPTNLKLQGYFDSRQSVDRFLDLFHAIGYQYTTSTNVINKRFTYEWDEINERYKIYGVKKDNNKILEIDKDRIRERSNYYVKPFFDTTISESGKEDFDYHSVFVEDLLTILAFDCLYKAYSKNPENWSYDDICNLLKKEKIDEKYCISSFLGDSQETVDGFTSRIPLAEGEKITVMELPYYNFYKGDELPDKLPAGFNPKESLPIINLGREVITFDSPIKFHEFSYDIIKDNNGNITDITHNNKENDKYVVIRAYQLPQIQYLIMLFESLPEPHELLDTLASYYRYNFQVPNITKSVPTFIGSSGIEWADSQYRKLREVETWSSNYCWDNYPHRHFIFVESQRQRKDNEDENWAKPGLDSEYNESSWSVEPKSSRYKAKSVISQNSYVSAGAWWSGSKNLRHKPSQTVNFTTGKGENVNYLMNEINNKPDRWTSKYNQLVNEPTNINGLAYNVFQITFTTPENEVDWQYKHHDFYLYPTGKYRPTNKLKSRGNFYQMIAGDTTISTTEGNGSEEVTFETKFGNTVSGDYLTLASEIWTDKNNISGNNTFIKAKGVYEKNNKNAFEHFEDPRYDTAEPNRGRTSIPITDTKRYLNNIAKIRYEKNQENFNYTSGSGEWFSPENIKMLPLIKL